TCRENVILFTVPPNVCPTPANSLDRSGKLSPTPIMLRSEFPFHTVPRDRLELALDVTIVSMTVKLPKIWTIGHSTRELGAFLELLRQNRIGILADVRRFPGSRRHPHFAHDALSRSLSDIGIEYEHFPELGGHRKPRPDSSNTAWRNDSF